MNKTKGEKKKTRRNPVSAPKRPFPLSGRIFLHIPKKLRKGSLTGEAALVLPLFLFGMITMLSLMDVYRLQTDHLLRALSEAESTAIYICENARWIGKSVETHLEIPAVTHGGDLQGSACGGKAIAAWTAR